MDVTYSMVTIGKELHIGKLSREILKVLITRKETLVIMCRQVLTGLMSMVIPHHVNTSSNHYVAHLKLIPYINYSSIFKKSVFVS